MKCVKHDFHKNMLAKKTVFLDMFKYVDFYNPTKRSVISVEIIQFLRMLLC